MLWAGIGGLLAARVLADTDERVTEGDRLPHPPCHCRGVPQGRHGHGLQDGGVRVADEPLPGCSARTGSPHTPSVVGG